MQVRGDVVGGEDGAEGAQPVATMTGGDVGGEDSREQSRPRQPPLTGDVVSAGATDVGLAQRVVDPHRGGTAGRGGLLLGVRETVPKRAVDVAHD